MNIERDGRRWYEDRPVRELGGMRFRVVRGTKTRGDAGRFGDFVLYWETPRGWHKVPFDAFFLMADFFAENEEVLYPRRYGFEGWWRPLTDARLAAQSGYEVACSKLYTERQARDERQLEEAGD